MIKQELDRIKERISNKDFLENKGLSNEVGIHVFCYKAEDVLLTALAQTMNPSVLKGLERFISDSNKAYCYSIALMKTRMMKRSSQMIPPRMLGVRHLPNARQKVVVTRLENMIRMQQMISMYMFTAL